MDSTAGVMEYIRSKKSTMLFVNLLLKGLFCELMIKQLCSFVIEKERNLFTE